ncbi:radical SAM protein [Isachenkonia alkalipeptolytica]|nr:radical SAM protein [Isachenkonia alkalipeptolytica]
MAHSDKNQNADKEKIMNHDNKESTGKNNDKVPINRIIPVSTVDGPGARTAVFVQGCNLVCEFCHNPETQAIEGHNLPRKTAAEVFEEIRPNLPFIRGITVSGGECALYPRFLTALFTLAKAEGLTTLMDTNGSIDLSGFSELMKVIDGVMLDIKAWDPEVFYRLTGKKATGALPVNLHYLASTGKLEEIRLVCQENWVDIETALNKVAEKIPRYYGKIPLKLIAFRSHGVTGKMKKAASPGPDRMEAYKKIAEELGYERIIVK